MLDTGHIVTDDGVQQSKAELTTLGTGVDRLLHRSGGECRLDDGRFVIAVV